MKTKCYIRVTSRKKYLDKLEEKKINDEKINDEIIKSKENEHLTERNWDLTKRISFHLALREWAPGISMLGSVYGGEARDLLVKLDEEDMEYFKKKYVNSEALKEDEYKEKLNALNREYGRDKS